MLKYPILLDYIKCTLQIEVFNKCMVFFKHMHMRLYLLKWNNRDHGI